MNPVDINLARFDLMNHKIDNIERFANNKSVDMKDEALKKAASEFEAVFVKQFLDIMDSTVEKSEFMHGGQAENIFKSLMNDEIAGQIATNPKASFGLAEQIYKQLKDRI